MAEKKFQLRIIVLVIFTLIFFSGCSLFKKDPLVRSSPEGLYARGSSEFNNGKYSKAREYYIRLKDEYPLHNLAILAELGIADSFYTDKQYIEAESAYSEFLSMHPTNENIPYVIYQMGICHYNQIGTIDRDQSETVKARKEFERLIARFPESKLSKIAEKLLRECKQKQAEQEFYIGHFYFRQKKYTAALKRFETVARNYANVGLDYKIEYYLEETKKKIAEEEKMKKDEQDKQKAVKK
jgi:outer membrane protein assembly factor BamD